MVGGRFETRRPVLFGFSSVVVICAFGTVLFVPFLLSLAALTLFHLNWAAMLIPLAILAYSAWMLPIGFGNPWVMRRLRLLRPAEASDGSLFAVQLTLQPRICGGARALLEDADDFGWLWIKPEGVEYRGDAITFFVPRPQISEIRGLSIGWRGLFLYGDRIEVGVAGISGLTRFQVAERSSWFLGASRAVSRKMLARLAEATVSPQKSA